MNGGMLDDWQQRCRQKKLYMIIIMDLIRMNILNELFGPSGANKTLFINCLISNVTAKNNSFNSFNSFKTQKFSSTGEIIMGNE